jgi:hypothetical protein
LISWRRLRHPDAGFFNWPNLGHIAQKDPLKIRFRIELTKTVIFKKAPKYLANFIFFLCEIRGVGKKCVHHRQNVLVENKQKNLVEGWQHCQTPGIEAILLVF